jgi:hypothetical protein
MVTAGFFFWTSFWRTLLFWAGFVFWTCLFWRTFLFWASFSFRAGFFRGAVCDGIGDLRNGGAKPAARGTPKRTPAGSMSSSLLGPSMLSRHQKDANATRANKKNSKKGQQHSSNITCSTARKKPHIISWMYIATHSESAEAPELVELLASAGAECLPTRTHIAGSGEKKNRRNTINTWVYVSLFSYMRTVYVRWVAKYIRRTLHTVIAAYDE